MDEANNLERDCESVCPTLTNVVETLVSTTGPAWEH